MSEQSATIVIVAFATFIVCCVGMLLRKKDLFSAFNHPFVKKHPNISKYFGTTIICFALTWFLLFIFLII